MKNITRIGGVGLAIWLMIKFVFPSSSPMNEVLIRNLEENESEYGVVVEMLSDDKCVGAIYLDKVRLLKGGPSLSVIENDPANVDITDDRLHEYRKLLKSIGAKLFFRNAKGDVYFQFWGSGFGGHTHYKGIVWIPESSTSATSSAFQLTKIKNGWYIYED